MIGTRVRKSFDGAWHSGTVSWDDPFFTVTFDDGDTEDFKPADLTSLGQGVFVGARIKVHCGAEAGWVQGEVSERYRKLHGTIWEAEGQPHPSTAADSWCVWFGKEWSVVDLRTSRKSADESAGVPGTWVPN